MDTRGRSRKARFTAALALAEMTQGEWADEHGITTSHLYHVLTNRRDSAVLTSAIDAFIDEHLPSGNGAAA